MTPPEETAELVYSTLAEDPDLGEIVDLFVQEMPERVDNILARLHSGDWEGLRRAAHQLKGAAGSYGFAPITPSAARLEAAVRQARPEDEIRQAVEELINLCERARGGTPA